MLRLLLVLAALPPPQQDPEPTPVAPETFRIRTIDVATGDVYSDADAAQSALYRLVNAVHVPTRESVVRREMWFAEGDRITRDQAEELERNLRGTRLFASVDVELVETGEPGERDLVVTTRDRLSLIFSASGALVGGVGSYRATVGETNFLGRGDRIVLDFRENDQDERTIGLSVTDRHFLDRRLRLSASAGETEEGRFYSLRLRRRFLHLEDPWSWSATGSHSKDAADFFASGLTVAEVPRRADQLHATVEHAWGPRDDRRTLGFDVRWNDTTYDPAIGAGAAGIDVPGDTQRLTAGPFYRVDHVTGRRQVENLDTLDFTQDLQLGWRPSVFVAGAVRDEEGVGQRIEPVVNASVRAAVETDPGTFLTTRASGTLRMHDSDAQGWSTSASLHAFHFASARHTLAASLTYDEVFEGEGLPRQLTLGEDNGLRGYPAREFTGDRRFRLNLEDRIDTGLELRSIHMDLVAFADAGWIDGQAIPTDEDRGRALTSAGFGLRFGSSELFGRGVLRVDVAFPLTDVAGFDDDVSVSVAFGQVFTFFGNASVL